MKKSQKAWSAAEPALIAAQWRNETPDVERMPQAQLVTWRQTAGRTLIFFFFFFFFLCYKYDKRWYVDKPTMF